MVCTGERVYVDRLLRVPYRQSVRHGQPALRVLLALAHKHVVIGQARRDSGHGQDLVLEKIGAAPREMAPMDADLERHAGQPQFCHRQNQGDLQRATTNRAFPEYESAR